MRPQAFNDKWIFYKQGSSDRQEITLPHDAMIHEEREPQGEGGSAHGFFPGGVYIYEKTFTAPAEWEDKTVSLLFEGVYRNSTVMINGKKAGGHSYGYVPFTICADGLLDYGGENTVTVTVDNSRLPNSRWYSGSGIYRPVSLIIGNKAHIEWQGVQISTLSYQPARIQVRTKAVGGQVSVEILDGGRVVAAAAETVSEERDSSRVETATERKGSSGARKGSEGKSFAREGVIPEERGSGDMESAGAADFGGREITMEFHIPDAKLWSDESPNLYTCHVTLTENGNPVDEVTETFGIRKIEWSNRGLFVNGKETLLRGGCFHHDNGILGAATFDRSEERRVRIMKEAGFNALRSSHNPASRALLEACDRYGMYLMDETWDMWYAHKSKYDYAGDFMDHYKDDIKAMVERDFNHPSVIFYSIGNEVSEPAQEKGVRLAEEMVDYIHSLDGNRAVTGGINLMIISRSAKGNGIYKEEGGREDDGKQNKMNGMSSTMFNMVTSMVGPGMNKGANGKKADAVTSPVLDTLDIAGYNYASGRYPLEGKAHPERVVFGSETFPQDIYKNWQMVKRYPYLVGDFMWTAWDYLGEAGIGAWAYTPDGKAFDKPYPWLLADVGAIDLLGNPGGELFLAQAAWGLLRKPAIAVRPVNHPGVRPAKSVWRGTNAIPSWSWKGCEGNRAVVEVYTDAASAELYVNGRSVGRKKVKEGKAVFQTKYAPGVLTAVARDGAGKEISRSELRSASNRLRLRAEPEEKTMTVGDIAYIPVDIADEKGIVECNEDRKLSVTVTGGELLAFGSANPRTEERYDSGSFTTYYGRAMAVLRANQAGTITLTVTDGKLTGKAEIEVMETACSMSVRTIEEH